MTTPKQRNLTICLTVIYLAAVIAVIMFKFPFKGAEFGSTRAIELIPFYVAEIKDISFFSGNLLYNFLFFVPLGVFVSLLKPDWKFAKKVAPIALLSLSFEVLQYILGIGVSDVTDLITNTAGGIAGIGVYAVTRKLFGDKTHKVINAIAMVFVAVMIILFGLASRFTIR
ncbi:MAG: VanZ family protein [Oscillospiraceae bacterium]|jgi:glycopeptide antibiotics resistance protein|nr:VanZ family protein [Oscillospiraceae bacterium]